MGSLARLSGKERRFIKGQKYTLLSRKENLTLEGRQALRTLLRAKFKNPPSVLLRQADDPLFNHGKLVAPNVHGFLVPRNFQYLVDKVGIVLQLGYLMPGRTV